MLEVLRCKKFAQLTSNRTFWVSVPVPAVASGSTRLRATRSRDCCAISRLLHEVMNCTGGSTIIGSRDCRAISYLRNALTRSWDCANHKNARNTAKSTHSENVKRCDCFCYIPDITYIFCEAWHGRRGSSSLLISFSNQRKSCTRVTRGKHANSTHLSPCLYNLKIFFLRRITASLFVAWKIQICRNLAHFISYDLKSIWTSCVS